MTFDHRPPSTTPPWYFRIATEVRTIILIDLTCSLARICVMRPQGMEISSNWP